MTTNELLRIARQCQGIPREIVAEELGISIEYLKNLESTAYVSPKLRRRVEDALGLEENELNTWEENAGLRCPSCGATKYASDTYCGGAYCSNA